MITILPTPVICLKCLKSNYFIQCWQGANHFVQSIFEFCVKFYQVRFFFSVFLCCCSANKNNKHVNTKTFAIGTIFWEKCCIFWQNCKGADIFGHDCIYIKLDKISHRTEKWTGQYYWHLVKIVRNNCFSSMWCSCNLYLETPVASNRCGQYSNIHT